MLKPLQDHEKPHNWEYHRVWKDEVAVTYDDLADEEDLQRELERIQAPLDENRKHVAARYTEEPQKKEIRQIMYTSRWNRVVKKTRYFKNEAENDDVESPKGASELDDQHFI